MKTAFSLLTGVMYILSLQWFQGMSSFLKCIYQFSFVWKISRKRGRWLKSMSKKDRSFINWLTSQMSGLIDAEARSQEPGTPPGSSMWMTGTQDWISSSAASQRNTHTHTYTHWEKGREGERDRERISFIHWFTSQMTVRAGARPRWSQDLRTPSGFSMWLPGPSTALSGALAQS